MDLDLSQLPGPVLPLVDTDTVVIYRGGVPYKASVAKVSQAAETAIDLGVEIAAEGEAVATTAATADTPFGFAEAQANAIITNLNKVIANQNAIINAMVAAGWLTIAAGE